MIDITPVLRDVRRFPIKEHLFFRDAVMALKCMTSQASRYLSDKFATQCNRSHCQLLNIPLYESGAGQRSFYYCMVYIWNNLDSTLKNAKSVSTFEFYLKNNFITEIFKMHAMIIVFNVQTFKYSFV